MTDPILLLLLSLCSLIISALIIAVNIHVSLFVFFSLIVSIFVSIVIIVYCANRLEISYTISGFLFFLVSFVIGVVIVTAIMLFLNYSGLIVDSDVSTLRSTGLLSPFFEEGLRLACIFVILHFSKPSLTGRTLDLPISFGLGWGLSEFFIRCLAAVLAITGLINVDKSTDLSHTNLLLTVFFWSTVVFWQMFFAIQSYLFAISGRYFFLFFCLCSHVIYNSVYISLYKFLPVSVDIILALFSTAFIIYILFLGKLDWASLEHSS